MDHRPGGRASSPRAAGLRSRWPVQGHRVVALVHPGHDHHAVSVAAETFGSARPGLPARYSFDLAAVEPGLVPSSVGLATWVPRGLEALAGADTVLVPSWDTPGRLVPETVVAAVVGAYARGARVVTCRTGAYVVAAAGLLDGRSATTHWRYSRDFARRFPRVQVEAGRIFVDHGDVATSAGGAATLDLCLHLLANDLGVAHAEVVARHMVAAPRRSGEQVQALPTPAGAPAESLGPLLDWAAAHLGEPLSVAVLADRAGVSTRTLTRRFDEQLGTSPGRWLLHTRIRAARQLLETTDLPVDGIARRVGMASALNLRRRFTEAVGATPGRYRAEFRSRADVPVVS